jgi:hypothetical protein
MSDIEIFPKGHSRHAEKHSALHIIYFIAAIIVVAWLFSFVLKVAAWLINGLVYLAAIVLIIGLIVHLVRRK